ncbi:MAG: ATP-binding protein, partial [Lachnospiraceae bacterium]|nr:ATP-binding protein [Lachnospiraceae bacterium]
MLGGSFAIAFLRNGIGAALMMTVFLLLDHPRLSMKKAIGCYAAYWVVIVISFSVWYALSNENYIRFSGIAAVFTCGIFCTLMSSETIYLSLYRVALGFYLLSVTVF